MFCKNCGKNMEGQLGDVCKDCRELLDALAGAKDVTEGAETKKEEDYKGSYTNYNVQNGTVYNNTYTSKSRVIAAILAFFFGTIGVHNFYLGYNGKAVAQLLLTVLTCGMLGVVAEVWAIIEGILLLVGGINTDGKGNPLV